MYFRCDRRNPHHFKEEDRIMSKIFVGDLFLVMIRVTRQFIVSGRTVFNSRRLTAKGHLLFRAIFRSENSRIRAFKAYLRFFQLIVARAYLFNGRAHPHHMRNESKGQRLSFGHGATRGNLHHVFLDGQYTLMNRCSHFNFRSKEFVYFAGVKRNRGNVSRFLLYHRLTRDQTFQGTSHVRTTGSRVMFLRFLVCALRLNYHHVPTSTRANSQIMTPRRLLRLIPCPIASERNNSLFLVRLLRQSSITLILRRNSHFFVRLNNRPYNVKEIRTFKRSLHLSQTVIIRPYSMFVLRSLSSLHFCLFPIRGALFRNLLRNYGIIGQHDQDRGSIVTHR